MENRPGSSGPDHLSNAAGQSSSIQRQLEALNAAERLRSSVSTTPATGNPANSSGSMLPISSSAISDYLSRVNPGISPLLGNDEQRGKPLLLRILGEVHARKGRPLPPQLTGLPTPTWNPMNNNFPFQLGHDKGFVQIAGQDIDLFKLWQVVFSSGMVGKITREGLWPQITAQLGLPPTLPDGATPTSGQVQELSKIYLEVEQLLTNLMLSAKRMQQQAAQNAANPLGPLDISGASQSLAQPPPQAPIGTNSSDATQPPSAGGGSSTPGDDAESRKRKAEDEDEESGRTKIRKVDEDAAMSANDARASPVKEEPQSEGPLLRRKIQYVPVVRTINTYGGRDLEAIEQEHHAFAGKAPMRKMEDFGIVDVETLILQLRSRLKVEVTTSLGLLYHLAYLRGDRGNTGLQLSQCEDLTDELLDLLEETAFANSPDVDDPEDAKIDGRIVTNREITRSIAEEGSGLFAGVKMDEQIGPISPSHQPWEIVALIVTIFATVASADDNPMFLAQRPRVLDLITRVCMLQPTKERGDVLKPASNVLQLRHVLRVRRDAIALIGIIGTFTELPKCPPRLTRRLFLLLSATLMDSDECIPPGTHGRTPGALMECTLEAFTLVAHPDYNRLIIAAQVPWEQLWTMLMLLVRIVPLNDNDIQNLVTSTWMSFVLKTSLAIYSIAVMAPLPMRRKMKASPSLRGALSRFLRIGMTVNSPQNNLYRQMPIEGRQAVEEYWRRIGETLKVIDAEEDPLAPTSSGSGGLIGYGLGGSYDLHIGAKPPARGTGMFGGARSDYLWSVMSTAAAANDIQGFEEWDYMLRVDSSMASRV